MAVLGATFEVQCDACDRWFDPEHDGCSADPTFVLWTPMTVDGEVFCPDCNIRLCVACEQCNGSVRKEHATHIKEHGGYDLCHLCVADPSRKANNP